MHLHPRVLAQLQAGVSLRPVEVAALRQQAINLLSGGDPVTRAAVLGAAAASAGVGPRSTDAVDVYAAQRDESADVSDAPALTRLRLALTVDTVLAELAADGHIVAMDVLRPGLSQSHINVSDMAPGGGGSQGPAQVSMLGPAVADSYRLHSRLRDDPAWQQVELSLSSDELWPLLGRRGQLCWQEALVALRRGLHLASANMAGAASEAAWYSLGERWRDQDPTLAKALDGDSTVKVIARVVETLRHLKAAQGLDELHAHAGYLRDLRNYGLHPRTVLDDATREQAFTESGCTNLLMVTHRYLRRLLAAGRAAGVIN